MTDNDTNLDVNTPHNMPDLSDWLDVAGGRLYYEAHGEGRAPIVLLHAGIADSRMWDAQFGALAVPPYRVARYDLRGFGKSDAPTTPWSDMSDLGAILQRVEEQADYPAILIGAASGASVALDFAVRFPDRVRALILISPLLSGFTDYTEATVQVITDIQRAAARGDRITAVELTMRLWVDGFTRSIDKLDLKVRMRIHRYLTDNMHIFNPTDLDVRPTAPAADKLGTITAPTLILTGEYDLDDIHQIADTLMNGLGGAVDRVNMTDAGHMLNMEQPDRTNAAIREFIGRLDGQSKS